MELVYTFSVDFNIRIILVISHFNLRFRQNINPNCVKNIFIFMRVSNQFIF